MNIQNCNRNGAAWIKSLLKVPNAARPMPAEKASNAVSNTSGNTHSISQLNLILNQNIMPISTRNDIRKSNNAVITADMGNTSRGTGLFFMTLAFCMMLGPQNITALVKNVHGTSALYVKIGYGTPSLEIFMKLCSMLKSAIRISGCNTAHNGPSKDRL